jgi:hypothetical protein
MYHCQQWILRHEDAEQAKGAALSKKYSWLMLVVSIKTYATKRETGTEIFICAQHI